MEPAEADVAKLTTEHSFRTAEDPKREWKFTNSARFDLKRGLLLESSGDYVYDSVVYKGKQMRLTFKLLEGEDVRKARERSIKDRKAMPSELVPQEFKRTKLKMPFLPKRYNSSGDLKPGQIAAHFNDRDLRWYAATMVEAINDYKVKIRYQGSNEEFEIHVGQLAPMPDKEPRAK